MNEAKERAEREQKMLKQTSKAIIIFVIMLLSGCAVTSATVRDVEQKPLYVSDCSRYDGVQDEFHQRLDEAAAQLLNSRRLDPKARVAVADFVDLNGNTSDLGRYIAEELINDLSSKRLSLVDRRLFNKAIEELKLNNTDLFDPKFSVKFGELTGATAILTGTVVDMEDTVRINARFIETETARVISTAGVDIQKTVPVCKMLKQNLMADNEKSSGAAPSSSGAIQKVRGKNLVVNGDFKNRYDGWERTIGDEGKGASKTEITRYANSKSGVGLHIKHVGEGFIQYDQIVPVADADLVFSASFQAKSHEGGMMAFSGSGITQIILQYMDENEKVLGQTAMVNYVKNPFADTPLIGVPRLASDTNTMHYVEFKNGIPYRGYKIDISRELEDNLIGVNPKQVKKIAVGVWCGATHRNAATELWISDISLNYK